MMDREILDGLNRKLACAGCGAAGGWVGHAKPVQRQNSYIYALRCQHCGERIVAKAAPRSTAPGDDGAYLRMEHATLRRLETIFPHTGRFGTLEALDYLACGEQDALVTRFFPGRELMHYARRLDDAEWRATFQMAGAWLRQLHAGDAASQQPGRLGVAEKIEYLQQCHGSVLGKDARTRHAYDVLVQLAPKVEALLVPLVRLHGDFKPANMMHDGTRMIGLDIYWQTVGAAVYDLAPFLNHVRLDGPRVRGTHARRRDELARAAFLAGYGQAGGPRALHWAQLYFALCHLAGYRARGGLAAIYAQGKAWPLIRDLVECLQA